MIRSLIYRYTQNTNLSTFASRILLKLNLGIVLCTLLAACSMVDRPEYEEGYGKTVAVQGTIMTRATSTPEAAETDYELINDWWVLFVDNNNKIVKYLDRATATGNKNAVEEERFFLEIPAGKYTAYSFANVTREQVQTVSGPLQEGASLPDNFDNLTYDVGYLNGHNFQDNNRLIPMTGKQEEVTFQNQGEADVKLEVIRMVAKLEFRYKNASGKEITLNSIKMQQSNTNEVPLLPNYTYLNNGWPVGETSGNTREYTRTYINQTLPASGTAVQFTDKFYMIEAQATTNPAKRFTLALNITREGGKTEEVLYAMTQKLESYYRNDHVIIPITISDYAIDVDVNFYPPIGGYPAVITTNSKEEFYCEFATQGNFVIRPKVVDTSNDYHLVYETGDPHFTYSLTAVSDPSDIFSVAPHIEEGTGELLGCLGTNQGTAIVDLEITVKRNAVADQIYNRRIYIIRKNK